MYAQKDVKISNCKLEVYIAYIISILIFMLLHVIPSIKYLENFSTILLILFAISATLYQHFNNNLTNDFRNITSGKIHRVANIKKNKSKNTKINYKKVEKGPKIFINENNFERSVNESVFTSSSDSEIEFCDPLGGNGKEELF